MVRPHILALGVLYLVFSGVASVWATPQYTVTDLGTLSGYAASWPMGINASGQVVGYSCNTASDGHAFLYSNGQMTDLGTLGGSESRAYGLNDSGVAVGFSYLAGNTTPPHACQFSNGAVTDLCATPGISWSPAAGINDSGQILGIGGSPGMHAAIYQNGVATDLGTLYYNPIMGIANSYGWAINNAGQVVGYSDYCPNYMPTQHAFLWSNGKMTDLGTLGGASAALALNNNGQVVGDYFTSSGPLHAFSFANGTMTDLGVLSGSYISSAAYGVNASGQIVGTCAISSLLGLPTPAYGMSTFADARACLFGDGTVTDLNTLISSTSGWTLNLALAINDSGWIVGSGTNSLGQSHAFLLTPIPEPSTAALAASGLAAALLAAWRRRKRGR